jgi:hypothetical protein
VGKDAAHHQALIRLPRNNGVFSWVSAGTECALRLVEAKVRFAASFVWPVAFETAVAQNRPNISVVLEHSLSPSDRPSGKQGEADEDKLQPPSDHYQSGFGFFGKLTVTRPFLPVKLFSGRIFCRMHDPMNFGHLETLVKGG